MLDLDLRLGAISAIVGCPVKSVHEFNKQYPRAPDPPLLQPQDVVYIATGVTPPEVYITMVTSQQEYFSIWKKIAIEAAQCAQRWLGITDVETRTEATPEVTVTTRPEVTTDATFTTTTEVPADAAVTPTAKIHTEASVSTTAEVLIAAAAAAICSTEASAIRGELFVNEEEFFDPVWDYDFTHIRDGAAVFKRGGEQYDRPCGWRRFALKVLGKYEDGNSWLGVGANAWPVSYHGTKIDRAMGIIRTHYKAGPGKVYGRGIYSTPNITTALVYSKTFTSKMTNKTYKVILQNRINPENRKCFGDYWLVPVPEGTSADVGKQISESSIRPYGLLLREAPIYDNMDLFTTN